ncbi:hypothetical protein [Neobacillus terrae]|uniref:hypothetical protein n=1 Tax=Neobacillus terrae TaxID=3034837 RepID=UPI00140BBFF8|nr:hypothetical protein [Neobacillus terrae]NHM32022.1 hypothetical protein [Neobacillus terrae]
MVINSGGNLSVEYFKAYFRLIMNSRQVSLEEAKDITFSRLFQNVEATLGQTSFQNFSAAYEQLNNVKNL